MTPQLLDYLCDPLDKTNLSLVDGEFDEKGSILSGILVSEMGKQYPIVDGVPRFVETSDHSTVDSFGDQWNYFNFDEFQRVWIAHAVRNTFGSTEVFRGKVVVDAGGGSGMQSLWMSQCGAKHVICLELSHSIDGIMKGNLRNAPNVDRVQCSIDRPPLKDESIEGMVYCHNVIHHTESVQNTANALWKIVAKEGEFVFNCYRWPPHGLFSDLRFRLYLALRGFLSRRSFSFRLGYSQVMAVLRFIPFFGKVLEHFLLVVRGEVVPGTGYLRRAYRSTVLNTYDFYGSHTYQHILRDSEIKSLVLDLQPNMTKILNCNEFFSWPHPTGCALRLRK